MLEGNERTANDLVYVRGELRDILFDGELAKECLVVAIKNDPLHLDKSKYLFWIKEGGPFQEQVREYLRRLKRLYDYLTDFGLELKYNQGLWLPAVADSENGDSQLNIMKSENWVTKNLSSQAILDDLASSNRAEVKAELDRAAQSYSEFRVCRRSGHNYRVAIRNEKGKRRTSGFNQYCVALGDQLEVVTPDKRFRKKREDAWRGVEEPLFKYVGKEGPTWLVYPNILSGRIQD